MSEPRPDFTPIPKEGRSSNPMRVDSDYPDFLTREIEGEQTINQDVDYIQNYRQMLTSLRENYGIYSPGFEVVINEYEGPNRKNEIVTQKITGHVFDGNENLRYLSEELVTHTLEALIRFMEDIYNKGGYFDLDLRLDQCMYGTTPTDPTPRVYFVDMQPEFLYDYNPKNPDPESLYLMLENILNNLAGDVDTIEQVFNTSFSALRSQIDQLTAAADKLYEELSD